MSESLENEKDEDGIQETLAILSDEEAVNQLRRSIHEVKDGKTIPWEEAKTELPCCKGCNNRLNRAL